MWVWDDATLDILAVNQAAILNYGYTRDELLAVLEYNPGFVQARANLGLALYRAGRLDDAEAEWRRTLAQQPANAQVSGYLGMLERQRETGTA